MHQKQSEDVNTMAYFLLIIIFLLLPVLNHAQNSDSNTSITQTSWFWPLLSICLALLLTMPCILLTVMILCYKKKNSNNSDESSISSNSLSSSVSSISLTHTQRQPIHHHHHHHHHSRPHRSHCVGALRSPPPPYTTSERPENVFVTSPLPPPYESYLIENDSRSVIVNPPTTVINVEPVESSENQSSTNPRLGTTLDASSTLTSPSIQTFQV